MSSCEKTVRVLCCRGLAVSRHRRGPRQARAWRRQPRRNRWCATTASPTGSATWAQAQAGQQYEGVPRRQPVGQRYALRRLGDGTARHDGALWRSRDDPRRTPSTAGTYTFTVSGTDYNGIPIAPMTYEITIVGNYQGTTSRPRSRSTGHPCCRQGPLKRITRMCSPSAAARFRIPGR